VSTSRSAEGRSFDGWSGGRLEGDAIALPRQDVDGSAAHAVGVAAVVVVGAEGMVGDLVREPRDRCGRASRGRRR
jgi:hypothetical protein